MELDSGQLLLLVALFGLPVAAVIGIRASTLRQLRRLAADYQASLEQLRTAPLDARIRLKCIEKGLAYYDRAMPSALELEPGAGQSAFIDDPAVKAEQVMVDIARTLGKVSRFQGP
jgi:hypothetical protein